MRIAREEIFGPVAGVIRVKDYDEALDVANDTEFGLTAGICTTSLKHASHFKRNAEAGMVMVNLPTAGVDYHVPFGGRKGSSYGPREQGRYAQEFYTTVKTAYVVRPQRALRAEDEGQANRRPTRPAHNNADQGARTMLRRDLLSLSLLGATSLASPGGPGRRRPRPTIPSKPVTIIVPFAAGGNTDAFARIVGQELDKAFNQRFVVDNKAGAGGNLGMGQLARAEPDGYTLGMGTVSTNAINPTLYKNLPYDPDTAFAPISLFVTLPNVLAVNPDRIPVKSVPELIETAEGQARDLHLRLVRRRHLDPPGGRAVDGQDRGEDQSRALQEQRAGDDRPDRRPCRHGVRQHPDRGPAGAAPARCARWR